MNPKIELPVYDDEILATRTPDELIDLMVEHEDRVPRNVIDECVRRGEQFLDTLTPIAQPNNEIETEIPGLWWLRLHAVMILGLIPGERAGLVLVEFVRGISEEENGDLQEWFCGYWPALMRNKPPSVITLLRDISADKNIDWYMRSNMTEAVIVDACRQGEAVLEQTLDWAARLVADEEEDWDYRLATANELLDYPRARHRELLNKLAAMQSGLVVYFTKNDIDKAYAGEKKTDPKPDHFNNPWEFYEPKEIEERQHHWQEEENSDPESAPSSMNYQETFQRETPKTGRNDPCPCGSGKKYKKCCLGKE